MKIILISFFTIFFINTFASDVEKKIIISAEKLEIEDGKASNSVITGDNILQSGEKNIADTAKTLPNVERSGSPRGSNSEFKIRGMEDIRISTKIDGSKTPFRAEYKGRNFISPTFLAEIGITRGSNSVGEGGGAIAGSVNLKTKEVEDIALNETAKTGGETFVSYSTNSRMKTYANSNFLRTENGFSLISMYNFTKNDNFKDPQKNEIEHTRNIVNNAMLKAKQKFNTTEFLTVTGSFFNESGESTSNPFRLTKAGEAVSRNLTNSRLSAELSLEKFNLKTFFEQTNIKESSLERERVDRTHAKSYGLNAFGIKERSSKGYKTALIYGAEITGEKQDGTRPERLSPAGIPGREEQNIFPTGNSLSAALYAEDSFKVGNFIALFGGRYEKYKISSGNLEKTGNSGLLKKTIFSYDINGIVPFIRYSEGYRAPLIKEAFASGNILNSPHFNLDLISNPDLKAEFSKNYETGFRFTSKELLSIKDELNLNFTYFIQDVSDFIIQDPKCTAQTCSVGMPTTAFIFQYQNLEKVRFKGIEAEVSYNSEHYSLSIAGSTLKAYETANKNALLQTPANKIAVKGAVKFLNHYSLGFESISASKVEKQDFRTYAFDAFIKPNPMAPITIILPQNLDAERMQLAEVTAGYSILNLNANYEIKQEKLQFLIGVSVNNVFNIEYKEQTSFIPGLGRNVTIYTKIKL